MLLKKKKKKLILFWNFQGNPLYVSDATESLLRFLNIVSRIDKRLGKFQIWINFKGLMLWFWSWLSILSALKCHHNQILLNVKSFVFPYCWHLWCRNKTFSLSWKIMKYCCKSFKNQTKKLYFFNCFNRIQNALQSQILV